MIKIDVDFKDASHIFVEHNIENDGQFAYELATAIDLIICDRMGTDSSLTMEQSVKKAVSHRDYILNLIKETAFCFPEYYDEE